MAETFPDLSSARLLLRDLVPSDADALLKMYSCPLHMRWLGVDTMETAEQIAAFIARTAELRAAAEPEVRWALERQGTRGLIGTVVVYCWNTKARSCLIGYELDATHRGHGYATEAVGTLLSHLFIDRGLHRVGAFIDTANHDSQRVLAHLPFTHEGVQRGAGYWQDTHHDVACYGCLQSDYLDHLRHTPAPLYMASCVPQAFAAAPGHAYVHADTGSLAH